MNGYANPPVATQFKPGQSGNPLGRPVGRRSLSTIIKDLLEGELDFLKLDTAKAAKLAEVYKGKSAWEAVVYVAFIKAMSGDVRAADWLAKNAYGTRQIIETEPQEQPASLELLAEIERDNEIYRLGEQALIEKEVGNV